MADADGQQLDRRAGLDPGDHAAQVPLEVIARVSRERRLVERHAVGDHQQDAPLLRPRQQPLVRPEDRLAVDVLLQQVLAQHQAEVLPRARRQGASADL
ncbi:MAG: hypothetical protein U1F06_00880 [Steroidobacteraceae bacterium]